MPYVFTAYSQQRAASLTACTGELSQSGNVAVISRGWLCDGTICYRVTQDFSDYGTTKGALYAPFGQCLDYIALCGQSITLLGSLWAIYGTVWTLALCKYTNILLYLGTVWHCLGKVWYSGNVICIMCMDNVSN